FSPVDATFSPGAAPILHIDARSSAMTARFSESTSPQIEKRVAEAPIKSKRIEDMQTNVPSTEKDQVQNDGPPNADCSSRCDSGEVDKSTDETT
ncbi:unnamed protein product, partial [Amoebophrya sp. A25]